MKSRKFREGEPRQTVIATKKGLNTLSVVSLNPDHFITNTVQMDITQQLLKRKIHIATIQETHIPRDARYAKNEYRIITSAAQTKQQPNPYKNIPGRYIAGVAIAIHQELSQHISQIERINSRILKITLDHRETHTPMSIIFTYAPHQGYTTQENKTTGKMYNKHLIKSPNNT